MLGGFSEEQIRRYSRHILLPEVGGKGQKKLLSSRVLCIGAGGLGSPLMEYLAAAGIGTLGITDDDVVDLSNLQRQVIHGGNVGKQKVESAKQFINNLNPDIQVNTYNHRLNAHNVEDIFREYDMVADCSDNFETRFLVNDACVLLNKPLSHGSIYRFEGQVTTIIPHKGPCYRCLFEHAPPPGMMPSCQQAGVLGVLPGIIGVIQATEIVKCLLGIGEPLVGRLIYYDALNMSFDEIKMRRNNECPVCGDKPEITSLHEEIYTESCRI